MKKNTLSIIIAIIISVMFSSCSVLEGEGQVTKEDNEYDFINNVDDVLDTGPQRGGVLKLYSTAPDTLNPILTNNLYVRNYSSFMYESLFVLDKNQKAVPVLADRWETSNDGLTWTFYLKDNIFWHNNIPFSAEDVEFTLNEIIKNSENSSYRTNVKNISTISVVNEKTLKVVLNSPNSFLAELMTFPIMPKHYYVGEDFAASAKNNTPVGTGPFRFVEYKEGEYVRLRSNGKWWNDSKKGENDLNRPYIEEIEIRVFDRNKSDAGAFQVGDIDLMTLERNWWIKYSGRTDLTLKKYTSNKFEYIAFNLSNKILREKEVRQAIAYAVDKTKIISDILPGEVVASDLPVIPDTWLNDTNAVNYDTDREKAKKILEDSGWKDRDGVLYKRINGVNTSLNLEILVNDDNDLRLKIAEEIKKQLAEVGINLKIQKIKWDEEFKRINRGKFDMAFMGCTVTSIPDLSFMYSSSEANGGFNISGYKNEEVDKYLRWILGENVESRKKAYFMNMKELINEDVPYLGLYFFNDAIVYSKRIRGEFDPYLWNKYYDITRWYIPVT